MNHAKDRHASSLVTATHAPPAVLAAHAIVNPLLAAAGPHRPYREIHITTPCIAHIFDRETGTTSDIQGAPAAVRSIEDATNRATAVEVITNA